MEQRHAELGLDPRDGLADVGRRAAESPGGGAEAGGPGGSQEGAVEERADDRVGRVLGDRLGASARQLAGAQGAGVAAGERREQAAGAVESGSSHPIAAAISAAAAQAGPAPDLVGVSLVPTSDARSVAAVSVVK